MSIKALRNTCLAVTAAVLLATVGSAQTPGPTASKDCSTSLPEKDRVLFDAIFNRCDVKTRGDLVTDDFEFYHDKGGLIASSRTEFVDSVGKLCERQKTGVDDRARRELVEGSLEVYPLNNYGAVQIGVHRFYRKTEGQPDKLVEIARFTHVWKKDGNGWRIARVLSYDHKLTE